MVSLVWARRAALVALGYYVASRVGSAFIPSQAHLAAAVWSPVGVALAVLLRWGPGMWPGLALGAFGVAAASDMAPWAATATALVNSSVPTLAAWAMQRCGLRHTLDRQYDVWVFAGIGVLGATVLSVTFGVACQALAGLVPPAWVPSVWLHGWMATSLGALLIGVPLLTFSSEPALRAGDTAGRLAEWGLAGATLVVGLLAFAPEPWGVPGPSPWIFALPPMLCWLAARCGIFVASATALLLAAGATAAMASGEGAFWPGWSTPSLTLWWGYVTSLALTPLLVTALFGELRSSDRRCRLALDTADVGMAEWDVRTGHVVFSGRWLTMLGHTTQSFGSSPAAAWSRTHEDDQAAMRSALSKLRPWHGGRDECESAFRMLASDGAWRWLEGRAVVAERSPGGEPARIVFTARNAEQQRADVGRHELWKHLFDHLHEGVLITDAAHRVLDANAAFSTITGYSREEMIGAVSPMLRPATAGSAVHQEAAIRDCLRATGSWRGEISERRRSGEPCTLQATLSAVTSPSGEVRFHALAVVDITQARAQRAQLERQAHFDDLTGLPNRTRLVQMLRESMQHSDREGFLLTVCYLDLDHFKPVNDRFGHACGDRLLVELAQRLRNSLRHWPGGDDAVARLGGDEFVLLLRTATVDEGKQAVERVMRSVCEAYALGMGAGPVIVTASIGATVYPIDKADADTLLRHADHAMYGAKQAGRNGYVFFDAENDRRAEAHFEALGRVQDAFDANQFVLYYQPKVDMRQARVLGVEALLRWKHPEHGVISPAQFLPLIEHTGLSAKLGDWVLQKGIEQLARWQRMGLDISVSINVSARHLQEPLFAERLASLLGRHTTPVGPRLIIEVLETAALADIDYTCQLMQSCRQLGVRFALDDFGTGYSTFTYLKRLPLDYLKIDRSFVHNMLDDKQDMAIVEGVIGLSDTFGCTVVAEGIELAAQVGALIERGCDVGQGNGIAEAMPVERVYEWVRGYRGGVTGTAPEQRAVSA
jgi:diguanylate cyclase (GGDEF)-like protein/PAS domain S-box-containing protein